MAYTAGLQMLMDNLKKIIHGNHHPLINSNPMILSQRPQFQLLYQELASTIQTLSNIHQHRQQHHELKKVRDLNKRFKVAAEEAQDVIDLYLSAVTVDFRNLGLFPTPDVFKTSLDLEDVMRSIESIKVELMTININNMKLDSSPRINSLETRFAATGPSLPRNPIAMKKPLMEDIVVGLDHDAEIIRDKLTEDTKKLSIVSIVGMGGLGKTTLATKLFNDPFIKYHFHFHAWATVSQTYTKRDLLIQILLSINVQQGLDEASDSQLREKLHKKLMGNRYLIVIDDIWSIEAWDELKMFFPHDNTGSRILLTTRLNEVALHMKPHTFVHSLPFLKKEESWELLKRRVFHGDECPEWLIKPGMQIAEKCHGLPLSVVVMAGVLATTNKDLWEKIAHSVGSYIINDQKGCLETLALSYHHLPNHLRECFLYLGGFPEDSVINIKKVIRLWVAEGFVEEARNQSFEVTANAYLVDLINRNLVTVAERTFTGNVKACKLHDLVRELCMQKAKEEEFFFKIDESALPSQIHEVMTPYTQCHRVFANRDINIADFARPPTRCMRSLLCFRKLYYSFFEKADNFYFLVLLRVLDLQRSKLGDFPLGLESLVHLRYLAIWISFDFPSSICDLWSLQTLIIKTTLRRVDLPGNISNLVNLRHLWSNKQLFLPSIEKPMNLQSVSSLRLGDGVDNFGKYFPFIKKLEFTLVGSSEERHFELPPYLETLKLYSNCYDKPKLLLQKNHTWFPATLKKLTLVRCHLPWSDMSIIQSLPNLEVLRLIDNAFEGSRWNACEQQFRQLKYLILDSLNITRWDACSTSFPCLKRLALRFCYNLEEIPVEIGDIPMLEIIEIDMWSNYSFVESVERIQREQLEEGNDDLKITFQGMELSMYLLALDRLRTTS